MMVSTAVLAGSDIQDLLVTAAGGRPRPLSAILGDFVSARDIADFGSPSDDHTAAFGAVWQWMKETFVDNPGEDTVARVVQIPPGDYNVSASAAGVNWTNLKARNVHVFAYGARINARAPVINVIDMTGTRWAHIHGLTIYGSESSPPACGILIGPEWVGHGVANGDNAFTEVNISGSYSKTPFWNIGSEVTCYDKCRFYNYNRDPAAVCYIADGAMMFGATSSYNTLRAAGLTVSFTTNSFANKCELRNFGGGAAFAGEGMTGWFWDRSSYVVSFNDTNWKLYQRSNTNGARSKYLRFEGIQESLQTNNPTAGNTGVKYVFEIVGDGGGSDIKGFEAIFGGWNGCRAFLKLTNTGAFWLRNANIQIAGAVIPGVPVFDAAQLTISGTIKTTVAAELNLKDITAFHGDLIVSEAALPATPIAGAWTMKSEGGSIVVQGQASIAAIPKANRKWMPQSMIPGTGTVAPALGRIYFAPLFLPGIKIDTLVDEITTGVSGGKQRIALYNHNALTGRPTGLPIFDSGDLDASVAGVSSTPISPPLTFQGFVWVAIAFNGAVSFRAAGSGQPLLGVADLQTAIRSLFVTADYGMPDVTNLAFSGTAFGISCYANEAP